MKKLLTSIVAASSLILLSGCLDDDDDNVTSTPTPEATTIVDAAVANGSFTTLVAALQATGLDQTLDNENAEFTVFAPTDDAFNLLGEDTINALLADTDTLTGILTYHVINGKVDASAAVASAGSTVTMVSGDNVGLSLKGDSLLVNTSTVVATDLMTDNGIIHVIDAVLMPPAEKGEPTASIAETAAAAGNFTTLLSLLETTGLDATIAGGTFTVFAPTDEAFAKIDASTMKVLANNPDVLSSILLQHVVAGEVDSVTAYTLSGKQAETASGAMIDIAINDSSDMLMFGNANITSKDIYTSNGIIHVIDSVVLGSVEVPAALGTITEVADANGSFTTLVAALQATGLDATLADLSTDFTVFAPTDDAFAELGQETIDNLLADPTTLSNILLYHVVIGSKIMSDAAVTVANSESNTVAMANGDSTTLMMDGTSLKIDAATVTTADVMADNGVIHVIDKVILPPAAD